MTIVQSRIIRPRGLDPGDTIGVVAPSSPFDETSFQRGIDVIQQMGFGTKIDARAYDASGYLAGPDELRAAQVNEMFVDDEVRAVMCARGGYGALRLLDLLDYERIAANPKPLVGFSDITALHQAIYLKSGLVTFHGPTVTTLWQSDETIRQAWIDALSGAGDVTVAVPPEGFLCPGTAEGVLVGGNLTVLSHLIGTQYWVPLQDKLLFFEDTGEAPYRIDRMLVQMKMAGLLEGVAGVVIGNLERCGDVDQILDMAGELFGPMGIPVAAGLPMGHGPVNRTIALGVRVRLDSGAGELAFEPSILQE